MRRPLSSLITKKSSKKSVRPVQWTDSALPAFDAVKAKLAAATRLAHPVPGAELSVQVDASDSGAGGVLQQYVDGGWTPLSYFSKTLKPAETRYSTFGRELLAVYLAVKYFRHSLESRHFTIFTDHKALVCCLCCLVHLLSTGDPPPRLHLPADHRRPARAWERQRRSRHSLPSRLDAAIADSATR